MVSMDWLDVMTIAIILIVIAVNVYFLVWLAGLPGRIAADRQHLQAEAIAVCGWLSLLTCFATWPIALIWAYFLPIRAAVIEPGEGQVAVTGTLPSVTGSHPAARFGVRIRVDDADQKQYRLPPGASGSAAISTLRGQV